LISEIPGQEDFSEKKNLIFNIYIDDIEHPLLVGRLAITQSLGVEAGLGKVNSVG
jgi:hypothetical protein